MKLLWPIAFMGVLFALGWFSGHAGGGDPTPVPTKKTNAVVQSDLPEAPRGDRASVAVAKDIGDILKRYEDPPTRLAASQDLLDWIDQSDEAAMRQILDQIAEDEGKILLTFLLLTCFAEQSADAAIDWCNSLDESFDEEIAWELRAVTYLAWHSSDPAAAIASAEAKLGGEELSELLSVFKSSSAAEQVGGTLLGAIENKIPVEIFVRKALLDGASHEDILREAIGSEGLSPDVRKKVVEQIFKRSRGLGKDEIRELWALLEGEEELQATAAKAIPWGRLEPMDALLFGIELGIPKAGSRYREAMLFQPGEMTAWIADLPDREQRHEVYSMLFYGGSGGENQFARLNLFTDLPPDKRPDWKRLELFHSSEGRENPRQTLGWLKKFDEAEFAEEGGSKVLGRMAETVGRTLGGEDMESLMREIDTFPEGVIRDHLTAGAITQLAGQDFERALELSAGLEGDLLVRVQDELLQDVFKRHGTEAGIAGLESIADPARQQELAEGLVERGDQLLPEARAALIDRFFADAEDPLREARQLNEAWMRSDPAAAAAWALQYADSPGFVNIVERLGSQWGYQDTQAAAEFVLALEPGKARDEGLQHVAALRRQIDPHQALEWSLEFDDPERRHLHVLSSLKSIDALASSPDEASEALRKLDLAESEKAKLKDGLDRR